MDTSAENEVEANAPLRPVAEPDRALGDRSWATRRVKEVGADPSAEARGRPSTQPAAGLASPHVGSFTFWDGRQPVIGPIGAVWPPIPAATSASAPAEEPQKKEHQQQREQYDDHDHVAFP